MIYFFGDSFTWGQGLYFEKWHEKGIKSDLMAKHMPDTFPQECLSYDDNKIRKERHFPNLVAKHFDRDYITDWHNGGTNYNVLRFLGLVTGSPIQDITVFQFTSPLRMHHPLVPPPTPKGWSEIIPTRKELPLDVMNDIEASYHNNNVGSWIKEMKNLTDRQEDKDVVEIYKLAYEQAWLVDYVAPHCSNNGITWIGFGWWPETGQILKEFFPQHYVPLYYKGKEHFGFESLLELDNLKLKNKFECPDEHLSSEGHEVIAKSIIKKIETDGLFDNNRIKSFKLT